MAAGFSYPPTTGNIDNQIELLSAAYFEYGVMVGLARASGNPLPDLGNLPHTLAVAKAEFAGNLSDALRR